MDYRKFLNRRETLVLPYLGGPSVLSPTRRLRVRSPIDPGWWAFDVCGRDAKPIGTAEPELRGRPSIVGHLFGSWLFVDGRRAEYMHLLPGESPEPFASARGRVWQGGRVLFDELRFDDEPEMAVREAWLSRLPSLAERGGSAPTFRGVSPGLKTAYGVALIQAAAREAGLRISVRTVLGQAAEVAMGELTADEVVARIEAQVYQVNPGSLHRVKASMPSDLRHRTRDNAAERATLVLEAADADVLATRLLGDTGLEVVFRFRGERFVALVDWFSLHVYDAGICLAGADEQLGLDALPSVIAEAMQDDLLVITR